MAGDSAGLPGDGQPLGGAGKGDVLGGAADGGVVFLSGLVVRAGDAIDVDDTGGVQRLAAPGFGPGLIAGALQRRVGGEFRGLVAGGAVLFQHDEAPGSGKAVVGRPHCGVQHPFYGGLLHRLVREIPRHSPAVDGGIDAQFLLEVNIYGATLPGDDSDCPGWGRWRIKRWRRRGDPAGPVVR